MNPFEPASLSPIPKLAIACPLPYDLTTDDLQKVLPGFEARHGANIEAFSSYEKQGLNGGSNSCILTLRYPTRQNQFRSETVFIKHAADPRNIEAQKYQALALLGIPTPRLLGAIHRNNAEIILLEFLPKIGIDFHSTEEVTSLLHLVAQLNAVQNPPELFSRSNDGIPQAEFNERVRGALQEIAQDRTLTISVDIPRWLEAYQIARAACKSMPRTVNHNEFSFQQVGWTQRDETSQLVIFDLETMSLSPRFADIAGILNGLAIHTGRNQIELFKIYFDRLCELASLALGIEQAFQEQRLVRIKGTFDSLPWLVDVAKRPELNQMLDDPLPTAVHSLQDDLVALGFL
jgi:hypothetical protein